MPQKTDKQRQQSAQVPQHGRRAGDHQKEASIDWMSHKPVWPTLYKFMPFTESNCRTPICAQRESRQTNVANPAKVNKYAKYSNGVVYGQMRELISNHRIFPSNSKNVTVRNTNVNNFPPQSCRSFACFTEKAESAQIMMNSHQQTVKKFNCVISVSSRLTIQS